MFVASPEVSIARVANRVAHGGHHVPEEIIRRRYMRGIHNFVHLFLPLADDAQVFDNSSPGKPRVIASLVNGRDPVVYDSGSWRQLLERANG